SAGRGARLADLDQRAPGAEPGLAAVHALPRRARPDRPHRPHRARRRAPCRRRPPGPAPARGGAGPGRAAVPRRAAGPARARSRAPRRPGAGQARAGPPVRGEQLDLHEPAPATTPPPLVLPGMQDLTSPPQIARALAARIPPARLLEVPGARHSILDTRSRIL